MARCGIFIEQFTIFNGSNFLFHCLLTSAADRKKRVPKLFPRKAIPKKVNHFNSCCFTYWQLTDVNRGSMSSCRHGFSSVHISQHIFLLCHLFLMRTEAVQERERPATCWCVSLCSSDRPGHQSNFILLQRSSHTEDVRLSQGILQTHAYIHFSKAFTC